LPCELRSGRLNRSCTEDALFDADVPDWVLGRVVDALWPAEVQQLAQQPVQFLVKPEELKSSFRNW
jgi:hypothetical protein